MQLMPKAAVSNAWIDFCKNCDFCHSGKAGKLDMLKGKSRIQFAINPQVHKYTLSGESVHLGDDRRIWPRWT
jgi:hypothetical protein